MASEQDCVGPEICCSRFQGGQDSVFCVRKAPALVLCGIWIVLWSDDWDVAFFSKDVGNVGS